MFHVERGRGASVDCGERVGRHPLQTLEAVALSDLLLFLAAAAGCAINPVAIVVLVAALLAGRASWAPLVIAVVGLAIGRGFLDARTALGTNGVFDGAMAPAQLVGSAVAAVVLCAGARAVFPLWAGAGRAGRPAIEGNQEAD